MSRRTAESNKAILAAWNNEQELVKNGKGTRDWTPKQQQDILDKGRAYDEEGVAFQGQHMKSAEMYPEYQGDPGNIQFLTRAEHLEAHNGNWRNPTNWYYDPCTKEKIDFGDGPFIPCEIITLSEPVVQIEIEIEPQEETHQESPNEIDSRAGPGTQKETVQANNSSQLTQISAEPKQSFGQAFVKGLKHVGKSIIEFPVKHPFITALAIAGGKAALDGLANSGSSSSSSDSSSSKNHQAKSKDSDYYDTGIDDENYEEDDVDSNDDSVEDDDKPYTPNDVPAGKQRYHYKDGSVKWKDKPAYHRGGDDENQD